MRMRRVKILEKMFRDVASPRELEQLNMLYRQGYKSSAVVMMLRKIQTQWDELLNNGYQQSSTEPVIHTLSSRQIIKISCMNCRSARAFLQMD